MTPEELAEIKARAAAATPGPWTDDERGWEPTYRVLSSSTGLPLKAAPDEYYLAASVADWEFITHVREDVPALVAEVERLWAERERSDDIRNALHNFDALLDTLDIEEGRV